MRLCTVWLQKSLPLQPVTHTYNSSNSVPCSDGYTHRRMSCAKLYRDERWGRPPLMPT